MTTELDKMAGGRKAVVEAEGGIVRVLPVHSRRSSFLRPLIVSGCVVSLLLASRECREVMRTKSYKSYGDRRPGRKCSGAKKFVSDMTVRASAAVAFYLPVVIVRGIYQRAGLRERRR